MKFEWTQENSVHVLPIELIGACGSVILTLVDGGSASHHGSGHLVCEARCWTFVDRS
jgi:hypothetical protein